MTKRAQKKRSVKARNPIAKTIREPLFHLRLKPSKKLYLRKLKHRGRPADPGSSVDSDQSRRRRRIDPSHPPDPNPPT